MHVADDLIGQRQRRIQNLQKLRELGIDPYPSHATKDYPNQYVKDQLADLEGKTMTLAGRLVARREHGKLIFGDILDQSGKLQICIRQDQFSGDIKQSSLSWEHLALIDVGDFIQVTGKVGKTQQGEVTLFVTHLKLLTKSIRPLPNTLDDKEIIFRKRYLDLILHPERKERFEKTAQITFAIREFLNKKGFLEIKTPILQPIYGGGMAKPFRTHVNSLDVDFYMAVSHELYLKRLITAGFENVYNIFGYFRNEGIDRSHNPEFTMLETMTAYKNYEFNMGLIEEMYNFITRKVFNRSVFTIAGQEVDFSQPWKRVRMIDAVKEYTGFDFNEMKTVAEAYKMLESLKIEERPNSIGECLVKVFEAKVETQLIQPTFVTNHPVEISPLAKRSTDDPRFVERFEIFIGGVEGGDNWTELNDPLDLFERFKHQAHKRASGDEETHPMDVDFIEMMEYGLPPTTGLGPGIERLAMMLTGTEYIDDVIFFPMMKPSPITKQQKEIYGEENLIPLSKTQGVMEKPQDFSKKFVIIVRNDLELWQVTNVVGHVSAYLGNHLDQNFDTGKFFTTADGKHHPRNSQYPIITLSAYANELAKLMPHVRESGLLYHGFIREMIETSNDHDITEIMKHKADAEMEYLAIGLFGDNEAVDVLTKKFSLMKSTTATAKPTTPPPQPQQNIDYTTLYEKAKTIVPEYIKNENLQRHCYDVAHCMRWYAKQRKENENKWALTGLLHDIDWETNPDTHPNTAVPILQKLGVGADVIEAILGHAHPQRTDVPRTTDLAKYLFACDEITGFINAYARMKPDGLASVDAKSVMKKMKDKAFARNVSRDDITNGAADIGLALAEHIENVLKSLKDKPA